VPESQSVTTWIAELKSGSPEAAQQLWERYFRRLVGLARAKLQGAPRGTADEEDVALSALDSFFRGAQAGRFPQLRDRNNLWPLLVVITARKVRDAVDHNRRQKRGGGRVLGESALDDLKDDSSTGRGIEHVAGREPTPDFAAQVAEQCQQLLDQLGDAKLRQIALLKLEGYTDREVATRFDCSLRTVERKMELIRFRLLQAREDRT
jgi:DNA-directed RNA polymerase specialized sigma24 family protein